jgi:hypothetical protein
MPKAVPRTPHGLEMRIVRFAGDCTMLRDVITLVLSCDAPG